MGGGGGGGGEVRGGGTAQGRGWVGVDETTTGGGAGGHNVETPQGKAQTNDCVIRQIAIELLEIGEITNDQGV